MKAFGYYDVVCWDALGRLKWSDRAVNQLCNEGQFLILDVAFRNGTAPANFYIGLMKDSMAALPAKNATLASLAAAGPYEITSGSNTGYSARQRVNRDSTSSGWPTLAVSGDDEQITSKTVSWTAGANWTDTIRWMFVTTIQTVGDTAGKLVSIAQLTADRLLLNGDTLNITYNLKMQ